MKLTELFNKGTPTLSFEVFPPKTSSNFSSVHHAVDEIAALHPAYMSVTYGAGGSTSKYTVSIASNILHQFGVTPLAHLTCVCATRDSVSRQLAEMQQQGIENVLALRGDIPENAGDPAGWDYTHASDLIADIKRQSDFCVGGACYPEGHVESDNFSDDLRYLKQKIDAGCDFLTTQMFFDNNILYNFLYKIREAGIVVPVVAGIMPVTNAKQIKRICQLSGTYLPQRFKQIVDRYGSNPAAMQQAGIAYATEQVIDLFANGVNAVHIYSMNKPEVAAKIQQNLSEIL